MNKKTVKFNNIRVNKKEFHKSKQAIDLNLVNVYQIVVSDKFRHKDGGFKYFIGYREGEIVKPLCIISSQMTGYIKYFENRGKRLPFVIKVNTCLIKYNEIWDRIKETLSGKFHSIPVYHEKYIKVKVREFNDVIKRNFLGDKIPKESMHYTCIVCITIDYVMRMEKKSYPQVYLEACKYRTKKTKMTKFTKAELESDSESESDSDLELELKV